MSYNLTLNSNNVVQNTNNSQFKYDFIPGSFEIPNNADAEIQLSQLTYPYSMQNISSKIGNNSFGYTSPTGIGTTTITINNYTATDVANSSAMATTTTGSSNVIGLSGVGYVNSTGTMGINITGATGFTYPLLITATTGTSGSVTLTLNQGVVFPAIGATATLYYYNATTIAISVTGAGNYILPKYNFFSNFFAYYVITASANSGALVIITVDSPFTSTGNFTSYSKIYPQSDSSLPSALTNFTFIGSFTNSPLNNSPYILGTTWTGTYNGYGNPTTNYLYNISLISGNYYKATINTFIICSVGSSATATYTSNYYPVTIPNGFYTVPQINSVLQSTMFSNGHYWYNSNPILVTGATSVPLGSGPYTATFTISGITGTNNATLPIGSSVWGNNGSTGNYFFGTITAVVGGYVYTITNQTTTIPTITSQAFIVSNNNEVNISSNSIYPLSISTNTTLYTNSITSVVVPIQSQVQSVFGSGYYSASGNDGTTLWSGTYPSSSGYVFQLILPTATKTTTNISNLLGFVGGTYPSSASGYTTSTVITNGDSLNTPFAFPALGSTVNALVIRCNLIENSVSMPSDVLQTVPINSTYGSNINFLSPNSATFMKLKKGRFNSLIITLVDQNYNPIISLDPNCLITLTIKIKK